MESFHLKIWFYGEKKSIQILHHGHEGTASQSATTGEFVSEQMLFWEKEGVCSIRGVKGKIT